MLAFASYNPDGTTRTSFERERGAAQSAEQRGGGALGQGRLTSAYNCPVCGFRGLMEPPRTTEGGGSYEICRACGFQFGVDDEDRGFTYGSWRKRWIERGMPWSSASPPPSEWNPTAALKNLAAL